MNNGTPKTLQEAIRNGMSIGPLRELDQSIKNHVRDFMSQKFCIALAKSETIRNREEASKMIEDLWFNLTGEKL